MHRPEQNTKHTLLGNSAWIFLIRFFPALASLVAMIWFSRYLDPQFYGYYQSFWVQLQLLSAVAGLGLPALLITYPQGWIYHFFSKIPARILIILGLSIIVFAFIHGFLSFPNFRGRYHTFSFFFLIVTVLTAIVEGFLISVRKLSLLAVCNFIYAAFFVLLHWQLIQHRIPPFYLFAGLLVAASIKLSIFLIQSFSCIRKGTEGTGQSVALNGMARLWFHLGLYDIIQILFRWGDKFVLSFVLSKELFAVYFNGTIEIPFLALLLGAVGSALLLQMNKSDTTEAGRIKLLKESSSQLSLIVFPLFLFFVLFRNELFNVVFTHRYAAAVPLFLITCFIIPLRCYNFTSILQHKGKGRIINIGAVLDLLLALVIIYPLYLLWGLNGVALTFVISTYVQAGFYLWQTAKVMQCNIVELMPIRQWLRNAIVFSMGFIALYYTSSYLLSPRNTLLLGGSATLVVLFFNLMTVFLKKRI